MNTINIKMNDNFIIKALYSEVENFKGTVQVIHGMCEHKERYVELINALNNAGYNVIVPDLRGHGESINDEYKLGHIGDYDRLIEDQITITQWLQKKTRSKKIYMIGHSMGSMIARCYLKKYDSYIQKLILIGTVNPNPMAGFGVFLGSLFSIGKGKYKTNKLLFALSNNMSFKEDYSWLSYNDENVKNYIADPLCGFKFDNSSYKTLFKLNNELRKKKNHEMENYKLNILSLSGVDDRTTGGKKGLMASLKYLMMIGYTELSYIEYENMKHEILFENNNSEVFEDIINFLNK